MSTEQEEKTEQPTEQRQRKLREQGTIAKSPDVGSAAVVIATFGMLAQAGNTLVHSVSVFALRSFRLVDAGHPGAAFNAAIVALSPAALPLVAAAVGASVAGFGQSRSFSFSLLAFKPERLDPFTHLAEMMPSTKTLLEIVKQLAKLLVIGWFVYALISARMPLFATLASVAPLTAAGAVARLAGQLSVRVGLSFLAVAAFDYWLAFRKWSDDAKMSKQEVKDEHREQEGRPEVREKIRRRMRENAKKRAQTGMTKATVLITNPTHFAVALRYRADQDAVPFVVAKGTEEVALQMRAIARKQGVPIVEQRPLARALHATAKVGKPIPVELYRAVAEVIAFVLQLQAKSGGLRPRGEA